MARFARIFIGFASLSLAAREYKVDGIVTAIDRDRAALTVAHRPIPGLMPAMTMSFDVDRGSIANLSPGDRVEFMTNPEERPLTGHSLRRVPADTGGIPRPPRAVATGSMFPDFELIDQTGREVRLSNFRGKGVAIQFVYTRCPLADVCPRLAANFATLQRRFAGQHLVLLSITVDPEHDTPPVLARYAREWGAKPGWLFLTGTLPAVAEVASHAGLVFWPDEGAIGHTSSTIIVTREGRTGANLEGSSYRVDQLVILVRHFLEETQ